MKKKFFYPYVGCHYLEGINGKKILVLGASFYCNKTGCQYFKRCTDRDKKDSSEYDLICPEYVWKGMTLHDEPTNCVSDQPHAYRIFGANVAHLLSMTQEEFWSCVAFTNYVQFFLPAQKGKFATTRISDVTQRDFESFIEVLTELKPDIVIVWGGVINSFIKEKNPFLLSMSELENSEYYVCHINVIGIDHKITIINPDHPSSSAWFSNLTKFNKYLMDVLH